MWKEKLQDTAASHPWLAAVGILLILEHRYHFPLLYVGLFDVVGLYHNTMRFDVKKPRFLGRA